MLLLIDLDDTLIGRTDAFERWAREFAAANGGSAEDALWIVEQDRGGYCPRVELAALLKERFTLPQSVDEVLNSSMAAHLEQVRLFPGVADMLGRFRTAGWSIVIVTNGLTERQLIKYRHVGLESLVDGVVVSQAAGSSKPDSKIFDDALELVPHSDVVWMVGDNATADVLGGLRKGFSTAWISLGREPNFDYEATIVADSTVEALARILEHS